MLTVPEMQSIINLIDTANRSQWHPSTGERYNAIRGKLQDAMVNIRAVEAATKLAKPEGTLIENITPEEAMDYSQRGEMLMLAAAKGTVPELAHAKLAAIMTGLVTAICRLAGIPRMLFCNDLMSNVLFTALKAAYNEGLRGGSGGDMDDGQS